MYAVEMETEFSKWLNEEIRQRGWSMSELARRAGVSHAQVSNVINGIQKPGSKFCVGVAKALGLQDEDVFRLAGVMGAGRSVSDGEFTELKSEYAKLSDNDRILVLRIIRALAALSRLED